MQNKFTEIYQKKIWGNGSGAGSSLKYNKQYVSFLQDFFRTNNITSITDIGCGDWQFSQYINFDGIFYTGIDVVDSVIKANENYRRTNVRFVCRDIYDINSIREYTDVDLILIKDVLQHWSDQEVDTFLEQITQTKAKNILITRAYKHFRDKEKTVYPRDINNRYSFAPLDLMHERYARYNFKKVFKYKFKEVVLYQR